MPTPVPIRAEHASQRCPGTSVFQTDISFWRKTTVPPARKPLSPVTTKIPSWIQAISPCPLAPRVREFKRMMDVVNTKSNMRLMSACRSSVRVCEGTSCLLRIHGFNRFAIHIAVCLSHCGHAEVLHGMGAEVLFGQRC